MSGQSNGKRGKVDSHPKERTSQFGTKIVRLITDDDLMSFGSDMHIYDLESVAIAGNPLGILSALIAAIKTPHYNLDSVAGRARDFIVLMAFGDRAKEKGRAGNPLARIRQDRIHAMRARISLEYRYKQVPRGERTIQSNDKPAIKDKKRRLAILAEGFHGSDEIARRLLSRASKAPSARSIKRSRLLLASDTARFYNVEHPLIDKILKLAEDSTSSLSPDAFDKAFLGEHYRAPAERNLYVPKVIGALRGSPRLRRTPLEIEYSFFAGSDNDLDWSWQTNLQSLERAVNAGSLLALLDGLRHFNRSEDDAPSWLLLLAARWVLWLLATDGGRSRGRLGSPLARCREELKHQVRCLEIEHTRAIQKYTKMMGNIAHASHRRGQARCNHFREEQALVGRSETAAIRYVTTLLAGTPWGGSESAITRSYRRFREDPEFRKRFWNPSVELLQELKLPPC